MCANGTTSSDGLVVPGVSALARIYPDGILTVIYTFHYYLKPLLNRKMV